MATKQIGKGITLSYDEDNDGLSYTTIGEIINLTPPTKSQEDVDATTTTSTLEEFLPSDPPNYGEVTFDQIWHPGDTNHELIDTAWANKHTYGWKITYPFSTPVVDDFDAWVKSIGPQQIVNKDTIKRTVVLRLTTSITRA